MYDRCQQETAPTAHRRRVAGAGARTLALLAVVLLARPVQAESPTVQLATLQWEPYVGEYLRNQGFTTEIVRRAFAESGYRLEVEFTSWSRALEGTEDGAFDGAFPAYYSEERAAVYEYSEPFGSSPLGFVRLKERDIAYDTLRDLEGLQIGVVKGYVNTPEIDESDFLTLVKAWDDGGNLNRLLIGRLDLIVIDFNTARYILHESIPRHADSVVFMAPPLEEKHLHIAFSRAVDGYRERVEAFNEGLRAIQESGEVARILESHGMQ